MTRSLETNVEVLFELKRVSTQRVVTRIFYAAVGLLERLYFFLSKGDFDAELAEGRRVSS